MNASERRHHHRYPAGHLKVLVKSRQAEGSYWETGEISSVDFNRFGIGLETEQNFTVGEVISIVIRTDDSTICEVTGIICNRRQSEEGYRFGIVFQGCGDDLDPQLPVNQELLMLERAAATHIH